MCVYVWARACPHGVCMWVRKSVRMCLHGCVCVVCMSVCVCGDGGGVGVCVCVCV